MLYTQSNIANNSKDATLYTFWVGVNDMHDLFLKKAQNYAEKLSIMEKGLDTLDACMVTFFYICTLFTFN
jgi:hypothetical protein